MGAFPNAKLRCFTHSDIKEICSINHYVLPFFSHSNINIVVILSFFTLSHFKSNRFFFVLNNSWCMISYEFCYVWYMISVTNQKKYIMWHCWSSDKEQKRNIHCKKVLFNQLHIVFISQEHNLFLWRVFVSICIPQWFMTQQVIRFSTHYIPQSFLWRWSADWIKAEKKIAQLEVFQFLTCASCCKKINNMMPDLYNIQNDSDWFR